MWVREHNLQPGVSEAADLGKDSIFIGCGDVPVYK
jgi:hypothetical protein